MTHDSLFLCHHVFCSDDDADTVEDIFVGYDETLNLVVLLEHTDYTEPQYNCCAYAVVSKDEAFTLAKLHSVTMAQLPRAISENVEDYRGAINPTLGLTRCCFRDLLGRLADSGCHMKMKRTFADDEYTCF